MKVFLSIILLVGILAGMIYMMRVKAKLAQNLYLDALKKVAADPNNKKYIKTAKRTGRSYYRKMNILNNIGTPPDSIIKGLPEFGKRIQNKKLSNEDIEKIVNEEIENVRSGKVDL